MRYFEKEPKNKSMQVRPKADNVILRYGGAVGEFVGLKDKGYTQDKIGEPLCLDIVQQTAKASNGNKTWP